MVVFRIHGAPPLLNAGVISWFLMHLALALLTFLLKKNHQFCLFLSFFDLIFLKNQIKPKILPI